MEGTISSIEDHGSIVIVWLDIDGTEQPVYFDHRAFSWLLDGEGCGVAELIGRPVSFDGETIAFLDFVEVA